jgi:outer membrane cobalamin receptor
MKEKFVMTLVSILFTGILSAQEKCVLTGSVTDAASRYPIPGVVVMIKGTHIGMCTNADGYYVLSDIESGTCTLTVSVLGYKPEEKEISLVSGEKRKIDFFLTETAYQLNPVTITSTRERSLVSEVPSTVEVVSMRDIARRNLQNVAQALELLPGIFTKDYGGVGDQKSLSIRGSTSGQVLVLIDGQKLNTAQTGDVDLSGISMESIERIEVVKGGTSALYGADAVGGVINIITKTKPNLNTAGASMKATTGSFGLRSGEGTANYSGGNIFAFLNYKYMYSDGNFEYTSPYSGRIKRANADVTSHALFAKGSYHFGLDSLNRILSASTQYYLSNGGSPGTSLQPSSDARKKNENTSYNVSYEQRIGSLYNSIRAQSYYHDFTSWYDSPSSLVPIHSTHHSIAWGSELQGRVVLNASNVVIGGYTYRRDDLTSTNTKGSPYRNTHSMYLQDEIEPLFGHVLTGVKRIILIPAARWDEFSDFGGRVSPKIGLVISTGDPWQASLKGNYGTSFRAPSFNDLYWPPDPWTRGNPDLKPESGIDFDIGAMFRHPYWWGLSADVTYFRNDVKDLILWQPGSNGLWMPGNIGKSNIRGIEAKLASTPWNSVLRLEWNYTYVDAINDTDAPNEKGKTLPYRPKHTHNLNIETDFNSLFFRVSASYVTKRYISASNTITLPSYKTADILVGWKYSLNGIPVQIQGEVKNVFDLEYQIMNEFPMPPREFRLTLGIDASQIITLDKEEQVTPNSP